MRSSVSERGLDFGFRLGRAVDRDFRKMVKAGGGGTLSSELVLTISGTSEAASVRGGSGAG
jgi:hypothetical protein